MSLWGTFVWYFMPGPEVQFPYLDCQRFLQFPDSRNMNVKGVFGNFNPVPVRPIEKVERSIKSDITHDRDPNGQQAFDQKENQQGPMSEDQLKKSLEHLRNLTVTKEHGWLIELLDDGGRKFVYVKDKEGNIIRRFPEADLWTLPLDLEDPRGQLLKKTA